MNRNQKGGKRHTSSVQVWTHRRARAALPYISSVLRSLREHALEGQRQRRTAQRLDAAPGRPDRAALIAHQEALREAQQADARLQETLKELHSLDVECLDPIRGQALIPFEHDKQLAWFLFDLFDSEPLRFWRYQDDPSDTRRPLAEIGEGQPETFRWA